MAVAHVSSPHAPRSRDELTPQWFTVALQSAGYDVSISEVRQTLIDGGHGFMSSVIKCELDYARGGEGPSSVVAKVLRPHEQSLKHSRVVALWEREMTFYEKVAGKAHVVTPKCYFSAADASRDAYVILLEDLSGLAQPRLASAAQAELAIDQLARLHAQFWGADDPVLGCLESEESLQRRLRPLIEEAWPRFETEFRDQLSGEAMDAVRGSVDHYGEGLSGDALPRTLLHYDYRPGNMLFGGVSGLIVVDWQSVVLGQGPYDLVHFALYGLDPESGISEEELIQLYRVRLAAYGADPGPMDIFMEQYRRSELGHMPQSVLSVAYDRSALPDGTPPLAPNYDRLLPLWRDYVAGLSG